MGLITRWRGQNRLQRMAWLSVATAIATLFIKWTAWWLTDSVTLLSDALEAFVNLAAALFALFVLTLAAQPADDDHHFGHDKAEYFSSAGEGLLILVAALAILGSALPRLFEPAALPELGIGLLFSLLAAVFNGATAMQLFKVAREEDSLTLRADAEHLLSDVWTSVAMLAGLGVIWLVPDQAWLDPVIALVMAAYLIKVGLGLVMPSIHGLMDSALPEHELQAMWDALDGLAPADVELTGVRTRKSGRRRFVDANLMVPGEYTVVQAHALCDQLEQAIHRVLSNCDIHLHVAPLEARDTHR